MYQELEIARLTLQVQQLEEALNILSTIDPCTEQSVNDVLYEVGYYQREENN